MKNDFYIAIPAYNEEYTIVDCLRSIKKAVNKVNGYKLKNTFICVNGCTDETEATCKELQKSIPELKIKILQSRKGMNFALNKIINNTPSDDSIIVKIDADIVIAPNSLKVLINQLDNHEELQTVGGYPFAKYYKGQNLYKKVLSRSLDIRSHYPKSQVASLDVANFHKLAEIDPQPIGKNFELRSRIYFHGRMYAIRSKSIWTVPKQRIGDDTYLTLDLYKKHGPGSIRLMYNAKCYYEPSTSLTYHWKVYKRIFCDTYTLFKLPEFASLNGIDQREKVKLDWKYINTLNLEVKFYFVLYTIIKTINKFLFNITIKEYDDSLWTYKSKLKV